MKQTAKRYDHYVTAKTLDGDCCCVLLLYGGERASHTKYHTSRDENRHGEKCAQFNVV